MGETRISYIDELEANENVGELASALRMCHRNKDVIADRLARLEDGIRTLADEKQAEAAEWDELGEYDNASEAFEYAQRLYTLLDGDK